MKAEIYCSPSSVITADLGEGKRTGRRVYWRCPFHDDHDPSLTTTPDDMHWKCFGCGRSGDAISWVREMRGLSFREAVSYLGGTPTNIPTLIRPIHRSNATRKEQNEPNADWQRRAWQVVEHCSHQLHSVGGRKALRWLNDRGLTQETVSRWKVGYNSRDRSVHGHFIRRGITIPWFEGQCIRAIKIRRPCQKGKYVSVRGSCISGLFLSQAIRPGVVSLMVEGEFDALLGWQELRDIVNVVTPGFASATPNPSAMSLLSASPSILLCFDNDEAGAAGTQRWQRLSARIHRVALPHGKDLSEFVTQGGDLRRWIEGQFHCHPTHSTRHPTAGITA